MLNTVTFILLLTAVFISVIRSDEIADIAALIDGASPQDVQHLLAAQQVMHSIVKP